MSIAWERGFKRVTFFVSIVVGLFSLFMAWVLIAEGSIATAIGLLGLPALPWITFYLIRWILHGFIASPRGDISRLDEFPISGPSEKIVAESEPASVETEIVTPEPGKEKRRFLWPFWPKIRADDDALLCIRYATNTALFISAVTGLFSLSSLFMGKPVMEITAWGLFDAALFLALAYGTHKRSRLAAIGLIVLWLFEIIAMKNFGIVRIIYLLLLANGMRGIFYLHRADPFEVIWPSTIWIRRALIISGASLGLIALLSAEMFLEFKLDKPFLLKSLYSVVAPRITGELYSPNGDWSLSLKDTKLEWRKQPSFMLDTVAKEKGLVYYLIGYPGLLATALEETGELDKLQDVQLAASLFSNHTDKGGKVSGYLDVPGAVKDKFFMFEETVKGEAKPFIAIEGLFRISSSKLVTIRFNLYEPTDGTPIDINKITHDVELIAKSFKRASSI